MINNPKYDELIFLKNIFINGFLIPKRLKIWKIFQYRRKLERPVKLEFQYLLMRVLKMKKKIRHVQLAISYCGGNNNPFDCRRCKIVLYCLWCRWIFSAMVCSVVKDFPQQPKTEVKIKTPSYDKSMPIWTETCSRVPEIVNFHFNKVRHIP